MSYSKLLMYLNEEYKVNDYIIIKQPSILDIAKFGENKYFNVVNTLCAIPSDFKYELYEMGIDYCKISDFECFILLSRNIDYDSISLLFKNEISFKEMTPSINKDTQELTLVDFSNGIIINKDIYQNIVGYIREMHYIKPKVEKAANKETKKILIEEDKRNKSRMRRKNKNSNDSFLLPLISSMVNSPGFKYDINQLKNLTIYQFIDSVKRIEAITTATSIMNGMYSGFVDLSKNQNLIKQLNWLRDLSKDNVKKTNVTVTNH